MGGTWFEVDALDENGEWAEVYANADLQECIKVLQETPRPRRLMRVKTQKIELHYNDKDG